jgi:7,8-dihydropterin-6-yl-methyl-4-(beta-D-ribofuranosyl)aminobenzene 5'-phosphate synthase
LCSSFVVERASAETPPARVTVLYDAFGKPSSLKTGWGYSALIEYNGRRILFDTGGKVADFAYNVDVLGVSIRNLDLVVLSHRHNDHTAGLAQVLRENRRVTRRGVEKRKTTRMTQTGVRQAKLAKNRR